MAQAFYEILQPFDFLYQMLDDKKAELGLRYIAQNDESLIPQYPAVLIQSDRLEREHHATRQFTITFHIDLFVFHAELSASSAVRSRKDIELATAIKKLIHSNYTFDGHLLDSYVDGEFPGIMARVIDANLVTVVTTRLTWQGRNRVPFEAL